MTVPHTSSDSAMDGNDDMLWNGSEDDRNLRSERMEDEGNDCED